MTSTIKMGIMTTDQIEDYFHPDDESVPDKMFLRPLEMERRMP